MFEDKYHYVQPSDTMSSICSKYRISAPALRQANAALSGWDVQGGPARLIIPKDQDEQDQSKVHIDMPSKFFRRESRDTVTARTDSDCTTFTDDTELTQYYDVQPDDTLQWICLKYGVKAADLRRANGFRGTTLKAAPDRLLIPGDKATPRQWETKDDKIECLMSSAPIPRGEKKPDLSRDEAVIYLEMENWDMLKAVRNMTIDAEFRLGLRP